MQHTLSFTLKLLLSLSLIAFAVAVPVTIESGDEDLPVKSIYQWPPYTFLENLRVRQNGSILLTRLDTPSLLTIDPTADNPTPQLVHNFTKYGAVGGIVETKPDLFVVIAANFSIFKLDPGQGTYSAFTVDYRGRNNTPPAISKLLDIPQAGFLDGIDYVPASNSVYMSDAELGVIWQLEMDTASYSIAVNDTRTKKCHATDFEAINGFKYYNSALYFTNTGCGWFGKVPLDAQGNVNGSATIVDDPNMMLDDFAFTPDGTAYLTASFVNQIVKLSPNGSLEYVAGNLNSSTIAQPTALEVGRTKADVDVGRLYIVTGGALGDPINGTTVVGAQLLSMDTTSKTTTSSKSSTKSSTKSGGLLSSKLSNKISSLKSARRS